MLDLSGVQGAHDILIALWRGLTGAGQPLPEAAMKALALLHSYLLLRPLTALGEHEVRCPARSDSCTTRAHAIGRLL